MTDQKKSIDESSIVLEEEETPFVGEGFVLAGKKGEDDEESLAARQKAVDSKRKYFGWRECIPCPRCYNCIQIRGYTTEGKLVTRGYLCTILEGTTDAYHTCDDGYVAKDGRVRVFIDQNPMAVGEIAQQLLQMKTDAVAAKKAAEGEEAVSGEIKGRLLPGSLRKGYVGGGEYSPKFDTKAGAAKKRRLMN